MGTENNKYIKSILLVLLLSLSFALGYIFAQSNTEAPIIIEKCPATS